MIADDIAAFLPQMRAQAESLMVDACTIKRQTGEVTNPDPPFDVTPTYQTVYTGKCRVQSSTTQGTQNPEAGGREWTLQAYVVQLPIEGSGDIEPGDIVTVTAASLDADLVGREFTVAQNPPKTHATMRRLQVEEVAG